MKRKYRDFEGNDIDFKKPLIDSEFKRKLKIIGAALAIFFISTGIYIYFITRGLPSLRQLEEYRPKLASKVYSADMKLIYEYYEQKRSYVPLEEIPKALKQAVIATEDRRFYKHWGMDLRRFAQAFFINLKSLSFSQGASTLTQQLARQLYLTTERTITRKIREIFTAIQIERTYTKDEILEMYLNHMYFGHGAYGVESAAQIYFGKKLNELTIDECALLVGLLKGPGYYSPLRHPDRALRRRNLVLHSMKELHFITEDQYNELIAKPLDLSKGKKNAAYGLAPYFTEYIRQILQKKYGNRLYTDGLSIYTTLDSRAQACAEAAMKKQLKSLQQSVRKYYYNEKRFPDLLTEEERRTLNIKEVLRDTTFVDSLINTRAAVQCALVSIDPRNGHILAFIGGRDFDESKFNRAVMARRQPGSAFKPFVYTVAIDN
ncbi:MAG: hypothetical protein D6813_10695, partial [Calditrichaeota bacterium]